MKRMHRIDHATRRALVLAVVALAASPVFAQTPIDLCATTGTVTMPDGAAIPIWGFAEGDCTTGTPATLPGPVLRAEAGQTLTITIHNGLGADTSVFIPGQSKPLDPVFVVDGRGRQRVRSFDAVALAGGSATYTWSNLRAGSYIYQSGTDVRTQVPMGLYGALIVTESGGAAYARPAGDIDPDNEAILFFSEIDPAINTAVPPGKAGPDYQPRYFLINGQAFDADAADGGTAPIWTADPVEGQEILLRFFNAGLDDAMPMLHGERMQVIAEDGHLLPAAKMPEIPGQYSQLLAAGKTFDALFAPAEGDYVILDRSLRLDSGPDTTGDGGQIVTLAIGAVAPPAPPVAADDAYDVEELQVLTIDAPGVLANDTGDTGVTLTAVLGTPPAAGVLTLNADGSFTYDPTEPFNGTDTFTYVANDGTTDSDPATVTLTVNANGEPVATDDAFVVTGGSLAAAAPGVLANDTDPNGDPLTAVLDGDVTGGTLVLNADGSFNYTPDAGTTSDSFTYHATDGAADSAPATVTLTINQAPVAVDDAYSTDEDVQLIVAAPGVLDNDTDPNGDPLTAVLVSGPASGATLAFSADGSFVYDPNPGFAGDDTFTYVANDGSADSAPATVTITVIAANEPPVAADDGEYLAVAGVELIVAAPGVLANDTDPDGDPLTAVLDAGPANGTLTLNADGSFTFTSNVEGADSFTYHATDGTADSNVATVSIWVNIAPEARDDAFSFGGRQADLAVLANDDDADGTIDPTSIEIVNAPALGTATPNADGTVTYRYSASPFGQQDTFTYRVRDDRGTWSNVATVEIN